MCRCVRASSASPLILGAALVFALQGAGPAFASDDKALAAQLEAELQELDRLASRLEGVEMPQMLRDVLPAQREALTSVRALPSPTLRLYRLRPPLASLVALELVAEHRALGEDIAGFERLWQQTRERNESRPPVVVAGPALLRALAQGARNRSEKYFAAALPYAKASGVVSGLYYLGETEGELRYEAMIGRLAASFPSSPSSTEPTPVAETTGSALDVLERETVAAFASDPGSQVMIPVSARLKEARELYERSSLDAAALVLLESRLGLSRRLADARDAARGGAAASTAAPTQTQTQAPTVSPEGLDAPEGSVRRLIAELAREPNTPANTAVVIPNDVLPLYRTLYRSPP